MRADNTAALAAYRARRSQAMSARVEQAIRQLQHSRARLSLATVARAAGVSRSWLYRSHHAAVIQQLRDDDQPRIGTQPKSVTSRRASEASLAARLETALADNRRLRTENHDLRRQLELALGAQRSAGP